MTTITIDMDKRCRACRRFGACNNGLCLKCIARRIAADIKAEREGRPWGAERRTK